jgi:hypothetical protein
MPAYSGVANGDWVEEDAVSGPGNVTDGTMRSTQRLNICKGVGGGCVRYKQQLFVLTRHPERRANLRPCVPCGDV